MKKYSKGFISWKHLDFEISRFWISEMFVYKHIEMKYVKKGYILRKYKFCYIT